MSIDNPEHRAELEAAVRRYVRGVARRYAPGVCMAVALLLLIVLVPSKANRESTAATTQAGAEGSVPGTAGVTGAPGTSSAPVIVPPGSGPAAPVTGPGGPIATGSVPGASGGPSTGTTSPGRTTSAGSCRPGVKQVPWLSYAPPCVPSWSGSNGGATARGVDAKTITLVFRKQKDVDAQIPQDPKIRDLQTYIDLFNKKYELYGRQVKLKVFTGQATLTGEFANQSQAQTQADAQTAYDMQSFAEIASDYGDSGSWASALAQKKIIALTIGLASQRVLDRDRPYAYANTVWHTAERWGQAAAAIACARMRGMPAIYAGDAVFQKTNRVFGLVKANNENFGPAADTFQSASKSGCNLPIAQKSTYSPDVSSGPQQAVSIITALKAARVTTVVAAADAPMQIFLMQAADQQQYKPEWVVWETAGFEHTAQSNNQKSMIEVGVVGPTPPKDKQESWRVYQVAKPGRTPESQSSTIPLDYTFYSLANFFRALQNAGPNLTPATFQAGWFARQEASGPRGLFKYGPSSQSVVGDFVISLYDPSRKNELDGKAGDFRECDRGARYRFDALARLGKGQLACRVGG